MSEKEKCVKLSSRRKREPRLMNTKCGEKNKVKGKSFLEFQRIYSVGRKKKIFAHIHGSLKTGTTEKLPYLTISLR